MHSPENDLIDLQINMAMMENKITEAILKKSLICFASLLLTSVSFAQKAELNLILSNLDFTAISGNVNITGTDTTINDNSFISPKTYILKNVTGIDNAFANGEGFVILPNPSPEGNVVIHFDPVVYEGAVMSVYSTDGRFLGRTDIEDGNTLNITAGNGMLLLKISDREHTYTHKIVTMGEGLNVFLISAGNISKGIAQKSSTASDAYSLTYSDPTSNLNSYNEAFSVAPGNTFKIEKTLDWTEKNVMYSASTNTNTRIVATNTANGTTLDDKLTSTGILSAQTITNRFDNTKGLNIDFKLMSPFTDTVTITRNLFKNEEAVIDTLRNGWFYLTVTGNGSNYTVKSGTQTIANALVGEQVFFKKQGDQTALELIITKTGYVAKTVNINMNKGIRSEAITLDPATYSHTLTGLLLSSLSGKTIKDGTQVYIVNTATPTDTLWVSSASGAIPSTTWYDNSQTETIKVGSRAVPGHNANEITFLMDDNETRNITYTALSYSLSQILHILNQTGENVSNVSITGGAAVVYTNTAGIATITRNNLTTDANNLPLANYTTNLTLAGTNIQTLNTSVTSVAGTNAEIDKIVNQIYSHLINGTANSSKAGKVIKNNTEIYIVKAVGDTAKVNVTSGAFSYNWSDLNKTLSVTIGSLSVPGHDANKLTASIGTSTNVGITFTAWNYNATKPIRLQDQFSAYVSDATIAGGDANVITDANGRATVTKSNLETDVNNLALSSYTLALTITKNGIETSNQNVNATAGTNTESLLNVIKLPEAVHDFYLKLFDINGDKVTDLTQTIEWADGTTSTLTPNANGIIHVYKEMFVTSETADISNGSAKYSQNFMVFRKRAEEITNPADTNYAQISKFDGVVDFARLQLTNIPDTLYEYVAKAKVKTPDALVATYGDSISITHPVVRDMMGGSNGNATIKFIPRVGAEKLYMFQMTFNETTGTAIEQTQLDRAKAELDKVLAIYTLNNGVKLFDYEFSLINSYTDAKWLEAQARDNYDNMAYTTFWSGNAYNGAGKTLTYSTNGKTRIKNSTSQFNIGNTTGQIYEEIYQQFTNNKDPAQGTAVWVTTTTGEVTEFAKVFARIDYLFNQGTPT